MFKKNRIIFISVVLSFLFVSSATAVPQVNGSLAINKIDEINQNKLLLDFTIENIDLINLISNDNEINSLYVLSKIIEYEIVTFDDSKLSSKILDEASLKLDNKQIDQNELIDVTKNNIFKLSNLIDDVHNGENLNVNEYNSIEILKVLLLKMGTSFINKFYNKNDIIKVNNVLLENGLLQNILSLILTVLQFIVTMLKAILQGFFNLFGGLIKTLGALIGIIVLILADIQTMLLLTGLYFISLGLLSKNIIKTLAGIGAPIFAAISAFLSIALGSLLGSISSLIFSVLGVIIILAIPIALVAAFLYFSGYFDDGGDGDGLFYIIASCIAYYMKSI
jgi:hypothetical protein